MTTINLLTREDLEQFKKELFEELNRMQIAPSTNTQSKKWLRSAEVRKMLNISPGTLQNLRANKVLTFWIFRTMLTPQFG